MSGYERKGDDRTEWATTEEDLSQDGASLKICGHPVMEAWEAPYMGALARATAEGGGRRILEVGFGLGLSASAIQAEQPRQHVIIEGNQGVFARLLNFRTKARHTVTPVCGLWQEVVPLLGDGTFDGILYDTYPLSEAEQHTHHLEFARHAHRLLAPGGTFVFCNLTSLGVLLGKYDGQWEPLWRESQLPGLGDAGFSEASYTIFDLGAPPPETCDYYQSQEFLVPLARRSS